MRYTCIWSLGHQQSCFLNLVCVYGNVMLTQAIQACEVRMDIYAHKKISCHSILIRRVKRSHFMASELSAFVRRSLT